MRKNGRHVIASGHITHYSRSAINTETCMRVGYAFISLVQAYLKLDTNNIHMYMYLYIDCALVVQYVDTIISAHRFVLILSL